MHILSLVTPGCFMAVFDLKDAYLVIPIARSYVKFLKYIWNGQVYMYVVLPFGLLSAPRKLTKLLKPILAQLQIQGIIICMYIDDGWVKGNTCYDSVCTALALYSKLGFIIHDKKSHPMPSQVVQILGFCVNSLTMLVTLPLDKEQTAIAECHRLLNIKTTSIRDVAHVTGMLISFFLAYPLG